MHEYKLGIESLDQVIGESIYPGTPLVIAGHPGTGKTTPLQYVIQMPLEDISASYLLPRDRGKAFQAYEKPWNGFLRAGETGII
ncbi:MAG: hypothetical protein QXS23_03125 [Desulfurococcaceae archaeon]